MKPENFFTVKELPNLYCWWCHKTIVITREKEDNLIKLHCPPENQMEMRLMKTCSGFEEVISK